jgi:hypothetical protein
MPKIIPGRKAGTYPHFNASLTMRQCRQQTARMLPRDKLGRFKKANIEDVVQLVDIRRTPEVSTPRNITRVSLLVHLKDSSYQLPSQHTSKEVSPSGTSQHLEYTAFEQFDTTLPLFPQRDECDASSQSDLSDISAAPLQLGSPLTRNQYYDYTPRERIAKASSIASTSQSSSPPAPLQLGSPLAPFSFSYPQREIEDMEIDDDIPTNDNSAEDDRNNQEPTNEGDDTLSWFKVQYGTWLSAAARSSGVNRWGDELFLSVNGLER